MERQLVLPVDEGSRVEQRACGCGGRGEGRGGWSRGERGGGSVREVRLRAGGGGEDAEERVLALGRPEEAECAGEGREGLEVVVALVHVAGGSA